MRNLVAYILVVMTSVSFAEVIKVSEGNVDVNGVVLWEIESGNTYVLANDISLGLRLEGVSDVSINLNGFVVRGDWDVAGYGVGVATSCGSFDGDNSSCEAQDGCYIGSAESCGGGDSSIPCSDMDGDEVDCLQMGCTWNNPSCEGGYVDCSYLNTIHCSSVGCTVDYSCDGTATACSSFSSDPTCEGQEGCLWEGQEIAGIELIGCQRIQIIGPGNILGFSTGIRIRNSDKIKINGLTIAGSARAVETDTSLEVSNCVLGTTKGSISLFLDGENSLVENSVVIGGGVFSSSKSNVVVDSEFEFASGSVLTEVRNGEEVKRGEVSLPEDFEMSSFVLDLSERSTMFGTTWCGYCSKQREMFGEYLPLLVEFDCTVVEGDKEGNSLKTEAMESLGIRSFPTWVIDGKNYPGMKTIPQLYQILRARD